MAPFRVLPCMLVLVLWLIGPRVIGQSVRQCIIIHAKVGSIVDSLENARYRVFPGLPGLVCATVQEGSGNAYEVHVWLGRGGKVDPDTTVFMSRQALLAAAERIQYHDRIVEGGYVLGTNPVREFAGVEEVTIDDPADIPESSGERLEFELASGYTIDGYLLALYDTAFVVEVVSAFAPGISAPQTYLCSRAQIVTVRVPDTENAAGGSAFGGVLLGAAGGAAVGTLAVILQRRASAHREFGIIQDVLSMSAFVLIGSVAGGLIASTEPERNEYHTAEDGEYWQLKHFLRRSIGGMRELRSPIKLP